MKKALILGVGGQDGSYLADLLLEKGYEVHGSYRRSSTNNLVRVSHVTDRITLHRADLSDGASIERIIRDVRPGEIYNEADQDHVGFSKDTPQVSIDITAGAVQRLLETVLRVDKGIKVFQPLSATMFGHAGGPCKNEDSYLQPRSPYACAKLAAWYLCQHYRREHDLFVSCAIFFNHESPRRGHDYLLQRIVRQALEVKIGKRDKIRLANMHLGVDIGYAPEYMEAAYRMTQLDSPNDFIISAGFITSILQFSKYALAESDVKGNLDDFIEDEYDSAYANEMSVYGDYAKASRQLKWYPETCGQSLIRTLVDSGCGVMK